MRTFIFVLPVALVVQSVEYLNLGYFSFAVTFASADAFADAFRMPAVMPLGISQDLYKLSTQ